MQLAVDAGLQVYGTAGTTEGLDRVLKSGAVAVFNHREDEYIAKVKVRNQEIIIKYNRTL